MSNTFYFQDFRKGKQSESTFKCWCKTNNITFLDVSLNPLYMEKKIDFLIQLNGKETSVDVKRWNGAETVCVETHSNHPKPDGWAYTSDAQFICWVAEKKLVFVPMKSIRQWLHQNRREPILNKPSTYSNKKWQSAFIPVKYKEFEKYFVKEIL